MSKRRQFKVTSVHIPTPSEIVHHQSLLQFDQKRRQPLARDEMVDAIAALQAHFRV